MPLAPARRKHVNVALLSLNAPHTATLHAEFATHFAQQTAKVGSAPSKTFVEYDATSVCAVDVHLPSH